MHKILAVDDEIHNLRLIQSWLKKEGYEIILANDGQEGWDILSKKNHDISLVLLDRMMPNMDGMQLLRKMKETKELEDIPVIMQTAAASKSELVEGIKAGVYYYLTKPFSKQVLVSITNSALSDYVHKQKLRKEIKRSAELINLLDNVELKIKSITDIDIVVPFLASFFPYPEKVTVGIMEILTNAVEHGNLGITYDEKTNLNNQNIWMNEINRRLALDEYKNKNVYIKCENNRKEIKLYIKDEGVGFNWQEYMDINPERLTHNHGRGIAYANKLSFDKVEYVGKGNEVFCVSRLNGS